MTFDCRWQFDREATILARRLRPSIVAWTLHARVRGQMRPIVTIYQRTQPNPGQARRILHRLESQRIMEFDRIETRRAA